MKHAVSFRRDTFSLSWRRRFTAAASFTIVVDYLCCYTVLDSILSLPGEFHGSQSLRNRGTRRSPNPSSTDDKLYPKGSAVSRIVSFGQQFVRRFAVCYRTVVLSVCPACLSVTLVYCGQTVGWIKMKLVHGRRPRPRSHRVRYGGHRSLPKRGTASPNFRRCPLWPNGWMDQYAITCYGSRIQPKRLDGDPAPPKRGTAAPPLSGPCTL